MCTHVRKQKLFTATGRTTHGTLAWPTPAVGRPSGGGAPPHHRAAAPPMYHTALGHSPFEVLYDHTPCHFCITNLNACSMPDPGEWLHNRQEFTSMMQQQLLRAQQWMKAHADKHRSKREFQVGDLVYLKVQPYVQISLAPRSCQKLSFRFFGPYNIL
jgi:hypothetical protein